jgi:Molecular chaperone (small heat shock protein)
MLSTKITHVLPTVVRTHLQSPAIYPAMGYMVRDYSRRFSSALSRKAATNVQHGSSDKTRDTSLTPISSFFHDLDDFFQRPLMSHPSIMPFLKQLDWIDDMRRKNYFPEYHVKAEEDKHILSLDLPGVKLDDLKVQVKDDNLLHISGGRKSESEDGSQSEMKFDKQFKFGETIDTKNIIANLKDGVLRVTLPKIPKSELPADNIREILVTGAEKGLE